jgi:hypothetical protein
MTEGEYVITATVAGFHDDVRRVKLASNETQTPTIIMVFSGNLDSVPAEDYHLDPSISRLDNERLPEPIAAEIPVGGGLAALQVLPQTMRKPNRLKRFFSTLGHKLGL